MKAILIDVLLDTLKIIPFLFVAFLVIEFIEHKFSKKNKCFMSKNKKCGPLIGGLLGIIPQCGFSALATNLFSSRIITIGTLIAIYLSTSDEMLPLLLSGGISLKKSLIIVLTKAVIGIIFGLLIDFILRRFNKKIDDNEIKEMCDHEHCHCDDNLLLASIHHTLNIAFYIFIASLIIAFLINYIGEKNISNFIASKNYLAYFFASLIGLIPNCASSVIITELYLNKIISIGIMFSGLLTGAGVGILVLFKTNKNIKENILIVSLIYIIGVLSGILLDLIGFIL